MIGTVPVLGGEHGRSRSTWSRASTRRSAVSSRHESRSTSSTRRATRIDLLQSGHRPYFVQPAGCAGVLRTVLSETR